MARSLKKGPFIDHHLQKKVETAGSSKKPIKTCLLYTSDAADE